MGATSKRPGRAIILGGGIGGLSTGIALRQQGIEATVYEQAARFSDVGAGIQVWVKGMKVLEQLGVGAQVRANGAEVHLQQFFNDRGQQLFQGKLAEYSHEFGAPMPVMITRAALIDALAGGVDSAAVRLGRRAVAVAQDADGVTVTFDDGSADCADVLVAADGINSSVRRQLFPAVAVRTAAYCDAGAIVEHPAPFGRNTFSMFFGRGNRVAVTDCGDGSIYWFVSIKGSTASLEGPPETLKANLLRRFRDFPEGVASVIDATPADRLIHHSVRAVQPMPRWGAGRIVLLGDAAHATSPNLGRSSAEAMVDAFVLASLLREADLRSLPQVEKVIDEYSAARKPEVEALHRTSWRIGTISSWEGALSVAARDLVMRTVAGQKQIASVREQFRVASHPIAV
ncbi:FAD-dependent monooxygenase [Sinomonas mesophila]|uniref:FAD-dependent monooxygenase n=1 Tax=Sinomonas mesophila TaxID=1531955 RepID=UPI000984FE0B|nr:FAD-dependent monooxygenase [Sinomonas mesophila]